MRRLDVAPYWEATDWDPDEYVKRLASLPLIHQPGETWMYHTGADILAVAIQRITGTALEDFLQERLFGPLAMTDSGYWVREQNLERLTTCYYPQQAPGTPLLPWDRPDGRYRTPPNMPTAFVSTASDYLNFAEMLLGEGTFRGRHILSPKSVRMMMSDQLNPAQKDLSPAHPDFWTNRGWGIGGTVYTKSIPAAPRNGSYSWFGGFGPSFVIDPELGSIVLLMIPRLITNHSHTELGEAFQKEAYKFWLKC